LRRAADSQASDFRLICCHFFPVQRLLLAVSMKLIAVSCTLALGLLVDATAVSGGPRERQGRTDRQVAEAIDAGQPARVLIKYRPGAGPSVRKRLHDRGITVSGEQRGGATLTATLGADELRRWASDPDVRGVSADARITSHGGSLSLWNSLMPADVQNLRRTLGLPAAAPGGHGVGVAVIDSGIAPIADVASRITAFYDFTAGGVAAYPSDAFGHGTHVAGLIAGSGAQSLGAYPGIAPDVRLIGLKVLDDNGEGYASHALSAIDFVIENRVALGIDIINLSLGHPIYEPAATDPLVQAVERAAAAGIVVVASAGNFGKHPGTGTMGFGGITSPGNAPSALTVGALRTQGTVARGDDRVASYSSRGPTWYDGQIKPDLLAPGHGLIAAANPSSALYETHGGYGPLGGYASLNGTSMAAAVTSGVVALMIEANRQDNGAPLSPNTVKMLLQYTAIGVDRVVPEVPAQFEQGAGGLNAGAAIELARNIEPGAAVGSPWLEQGLSPSTVIAGVALPWTQRVSWGDRQLWGQPINRRERAWTTITWGSDTAWGPDVVIDGTSLVTGSLAAWSSQIVWGAGLVATGSGDEHIVWGNVSDDEHIVWGNSAEDEHIVWGSAISEIARPATAPKPAGRTTAKGKK
jgi:serine protease AprX